MDAFLDRFYDRVARHGGDPALTKRLTKSERLDDFYQVEKTIWESLMTAGGQESVLGRAEVGVTIVNDRPHYPLPGNCRQFLSLKKFAKNTVTKVTFTGGNYTASSLLVDKTDAFEDYVFHAGDKLVITAPVSHIGTFDLSDSKDDDNLLLATSPGDDETGTIDASIKRDIPNKDVVEARYPSIPESAPGPGAVILSEQRGMMIRPTPDLTADEIWTIEYQKGPVLLHHATTAAVTLNTLKMGVPATDAGEVVATKGYYDGAMIRIFSADTGAMQTRTVDHFHVSTVPEPDLHKVDFTAPLDELPTGTVKYEICPLLPVGLDAIYAMDVAMLNSPSRKNRLWRELDKQRNRLWSSCLNYALSGVADRAPSRNLPYDEYSDDPYRY